jgi:hypothetical protein
MEREIRPLNEDLKVLGYTQETPGGEQAFAHMAGLMDIEFTPTAAPVTEAAEPGADDDAIDGPVVTEATLEAVGVILAHDLSESVDLDADLDTMDEGALEQLAAVVEARIAALEQVVAEMADREVPAALAEQTQAAMAQVLDELKKVRIVGGKVTRVNVRRGSKAMRQKRERRMEYKKHKAAIKIKRTKTMRKAGAKIKAAKTARKHLSLGLTKIAKKSGLQGAVNKVKKITGGGGGLVKHESELAAKLAALLDEGRAVERTEGQAQRDELVECIGNVLVLLEWITEDDEAMAIFSEEYAALADEFCGGALTEAKLDEAAFAGRVAPITRAIGACIEELEKNVGSLA